MNILTVRNEITAPQFAAALARGIGGTVVDTYQGGPWAGFGSPQTWDGLMQARRAGEDFYYGDHAYFGRGMFYRITKNAFQHNGIGRPDFDRLKPFYETAKPWRRGSNIVVCPQSDNHLQRFRAADWTNTTLETLRAVTDRPITVRRSKHGPRPLEADLADAWCVVTHSSACAIHALMWGVPAICTADSAARRMTLSDPINVEYPFYPEDRLEWAAVLAANQWSLDEMRRGLCKELFL